MSTKETTDPDWLPIETAPKGRETILLWDGWYRLAHWNGAEWSDGDCETYPDAQLWCPIPREPDEEIST